MDKIKFVGTIDEFREAMKGDQIVLFSPLNVFFYSGFEEIVLKVFEDENIDAAYADIMVETDKDSYPHIYSQFKPKMFSYHPVILSPLMIRPREISVDFDIDYLWTHIILRDCGLFAHRIPFTLFKIRVSKAEEDKIREDIIKINSNKYDKTISNNN